MFEDDDPGLADAERRRGSKNPPCVPVFFNLLADAPLWPRTGRVGPQRLLLVQYWRQMQKEMAPEPAAEAAGPEQTPALVVASDALAAPEPVVASPIPLGPGLAGSIPPISAFEDPDDHATPAPEPEPGPEPAPVEEPVLVAEPVSEPPAQPTRRPSWAPASVVFGKAPVAGEPAAAAQATEPAAAAPPSSLFVEPPSLVVDVPAPPATKQEPEVAPAPAGLVLDDTASEAAEPISAAPASEIEAAPAEVVVPEPTAGADVPEHVDVALEQVDDAIAAIAETTEPAQDVPVENVQADAAAVELVAAVEAAAAAYDEQAAAVASQLDEPAQLEPAAGIDDSVFEAVRLELESAARQDEGAAARHEMPAPDFDAAALVVDFDMDLSDVRPAAATRDFEPMAADVLAEALSGVEAAELPAPDTDRPAVEPTFEADLHVEDLVAEVAEPVAREWVEVDMPALSADPSELVQPEWDTVDVTPAVADAGPATGATAEPAVDVELPVPAPAAFATPVVAEPVTNSDRADAVAPVNEIELPVPAAPEAYVEALAAEAEAEDLREASHREETTADVDFPMPVASAGFSEPLTAEAHIEERVEDTPAEIEEMAVPAATGFVAPIADVHQSETDGDEPQAGVDAIPPMAGDMRFAEWVAVGFEGRDAGEPAEGARGSSDPHQMPALASDPSFHDAMAEWTTTTRDARLRRAGVIPMPSGKPPVLRPATPPRRRHPAVPALERFLRSAQARRRKVAAESVA